MAKWIRAACILTTAAVLVSGMESVAQEPDPEDVRAYLAGSSTEALRVVTDPASEHAAVAEELWFLKTLVSSDQLPPETAARIRDAVRQRLTGEQHYAVVTRAIDLASKLGDRPTLERIATNPAEVEMLGFTEPEMIERIQQLARNGLDGASPLSKPSRKSPQGISQTSSST